MRRDAAAPIVSVHLRDGIGFQERFHESRACAIRPAAEDSTGDGSRPTD
jgi:hypothetical protein